jgi:hypothetical protein
MSSFFESSEHAAAQLLDTKIYGALVIFGTIRDFEQIKQILQPYHNHIIYQRISPFRLWIVERGPNTEERGPDAEETVR